MRPVVFWNHLEGRRAHLGSDRRRPRGIRVDSLTQREAAQPATEWSSNAASILAGVQTFVHIESGL